MAKYTHFTREERDRARQTDLVDLLHQQGETLKKNGQDMVWGKGSERINIRGHLWYHQYQQVGGDAVDFVRRFYNKDYTDAVKFLLDGKYSAAAISEQSSAEEKKTLTVPERNDNMRRVFAYLIKHRGIDRDVLMHFVRAGLIFEDAKYHNVVFLGTDKDGTVRHVHKRGSGQTSTYKGNATGSMPEFSFHYIGTSNRIYVFEAPIDMLSYISMHKENWKEHSYVALCSVADRALFYILKHHPHITEAVLCLDNDMAGQQANQRIAERLYTTGYDYKIEIPQTKDWNQDLRQPRTEENILCEQTIV